MVWNLAIEWLILAVATVAIVAFIVGMALNAVVGADAFGPTGNAVVIGGGFFLAIFVANSLGYPMIELTRALWTGFGGALACMVVLASAKALLNRL